MPIQDAAYLKGWGYTQKFENGAYGPIYIGSATPGTAEDKPGWSIMKLEYDGNGMVNSITWPSGSASNNYAWSLRGTYTYS